MPETVLNASPRPKQRGRFREPGFIAGVIYGENMTDSNMVKFDRAVITKVLKMHGANARVSIMYENNKTLGFIKEVQRDAISKQITHVDVQIVAEDQEVKMQIPIVFKGEDMLAARELQLQIYKNDVAVTGKMNLMPETISVDVASMESGDSITLNDLGLNKDLKVGDKEDTVYGVISIPTVETENITPGEQAISE
jgi:large subunit ribosomal protein L25